MKTTMEVSSMTTPTNRFQMPRRGFLRGLGAAAAALPLGYTLPARAGGAVPKIVLFGSPNGWLVGPTGDRTLGYEGWRPTTFVERGSAPLPARLPVIFQPLERHRDQLLFVEGLSRVDVPSRVAGHQHAGSLLTGRSIVEFDVRDYYATGISVDQFIADRTGQTPLNLAYRISGFNTSEGFWSYLGENRRVTPIQNPLEAFERVFAGAASGPMPDPANGRRARLLDRIAGDLRMLQGRLPSAHRARLDEHLDSVDRLERSLTRGPLACEAPEAPGRYDPLSPTVLPRVVREHSSIAANALACGYTNVVTIQAGNFGGGHVPDWPEYGLSTTYKDHAIAHAFQGIEGAGSEGLSQRRGVEDGIKLQSAYADLFANLLDELASKTDVDGSSLLDNTLVVHMKEMGVNHDNNNLLYVIAGGRNLGVRGGRFIDAALGERRYLNDMLVAICHAAGLTDVDQFGEPRCNRMPIDLG